jgi:hypothetical protein
METLQKYINEWLNYHDNERINQDAICNGRTPLGTLYSIETGLEWKNLNQVNLTDTRKFGHCQIRSQLVHIMLCRRFIRIYLYSSGGCSEPHTAAFNNSISILSQ